MKNLNPIRPFHIFILLALVCRLGIGKRGQKNAHLVFMLEFVVESVRLSLPAVKNGFTL